MEDLKKGTVLIVETSQYGRPQKIEIKEVTEKTVRYSNLDSNTSLVEELHRVTKKTFDTYNVLEITENGIHSERRELVNQLVENLKKADKEDRKMDVPYEYHVIKRVMEALFDNEPHIKEKEQFALRVDIHNESYQVNFSKE